MDKRWLENYNTDVPHEINAARYQSMVELFNHACQQFSDRIALSNMGAELSYGRLEELSRHMGAFLQGLGLKKGARVAIMMPNILQYPVAIFAILRAGYIVVNVNPLYTKYELSHQLNDSGAEAIFALVNFADTIEQSLPELKSLKHIILTEVGDLFPFFKKHFVNKVIKHIKKMVPKTNLHQAISFNDSLAIGAAADFIEASPSAEDIAFLQYTGGTTGLSKGAMLSHGNIVANTEQGLAYISSGNAKLTENEIIVTALPLYHIFSLVANCIIFLRIGAKNILITNPRDTSGFIKQIKSLKFTAFTGVNTLFNALLHHPEFAKVDFSALKITLSGGMSLQKSVFNRWLEITGSAIVEAYGLSETSPAVSIGNIDSREFKGSIGLPLPSTEISLRDESGREVGINESGELCIRGPQVMQGYWQRPEETRLVFTEDGFFKTGDIARMDEQGYFYLVDRKKDMILVSGFNVYPNEVEHAISLHPEVLEVGVVGITDENSGEKVKACIVRKSTRLNEAEIIRFAKEHLTAYKVPKVIEFWDELPKTNVGKILRRNLKEKKAVETV